MRLKETSKDMELLPEEIEGKLPRDACMHMIF
jgi:hypothetical protein